MVFGGNKHPIFGSMFLLAFGNTNPPIGFGASNTFWFLNN